MNFALSNLKNYKGKTDIHSCNKRWKEDLAKYTESAIVQMLLPRVHQGRTPEGSDI